MFTITEMFVNVLFHARYAMGMFTRVRSVIIPPIANSFNCVTYILFSRFVTSRKINQEFFHIVKSVINFVSFSCDCTGKTVRLNNICTNLAAWSFTVKRPYWSFIWIQLNSKQVTTYLPRTSERDHRTLCKNCLRSSFIYNRYKLT